LVNALLQSNRWLAEMEDSYFPGVVHRLRASDRGLVLVAKTDETAQVLRQQHQAGELTFSYRVQLPAAVTPHHEAPVTIFDRKVYDDGFTVIDIDSPIGDTERLLEEWLGSSVPAAHFVLYRMTVPDRVQPRVIAMGHRIPLPAIELYTAPPCSVCNGTKDFLRYHGFGYFDHSLTEPANVDKMRQLRGEERGIPVIQWQGDTLVGFDRYQLKARLQLL
jgi:glutaredoxin